MCKRKVSLWIQARKQREVIEKIPALFLVNIIVSDGQQFHLIMGLFPESSSSLTVSPKFVRKILTSSTKDTSQNIQQMSTSWEFIRWVVFYLFGERRNSYLNPHALSLFVLIPIPFSIHIRSGNE